MTTKTRKSVPESREGAGDGLDLSRIAEYSMEGAEELRERVGKRTFGEMLAKHATVPSAIAAPSGDQFVQGYGFRAPGEQDWR